MCGTDLFKITHSAAKLRALVKVIADQDGLEEFLQQQKKDFSSNSIHTAYLWLQISFDIRRWCTTHYLSYPFLANMEPVSNNICFPVKTDILGYLTLTFKTQIKWKLTSLPWITSEKFINSQIPSPKSLLFATPLW